MKYLQLIRVADDDATARAAAEHGTDPSAWVDDTTRRGLRLDGERLRPESDATTVRRRGAETIVTDGPFAEAREQIGGFDLMQAADLDEAVAVAAAHPVASFGAIEVRELMPFTVPDLDAPPPPEEPEALPDGWRRYLLLMGTDASTELDIAAPHESVDWLGELRMWIESAVDKGYMGDGAALQGPEEARPVRVRDGATLVVDGPFAEAREHVAGYNVVQAPSLDDVIELAATHPASSIGPIEIRPLWTM
jgi:hypothetical protein